MHSLRLPLLVFVTTIPMILTGGSVQAEDSKPPEPPGAPARAERKRPEGMDPAARLKMLAEKLSLTDEQQSKVKEIFQSNAPAMREIMSKGRENLTADDKTKLRELMKSQQESVRGILTAEQQAKFKEIVAQRGQKE